MRFDVLTLFPELIDTVCASSILGRAAEAGLIEVCSHNIRDYSRDKHRRVDDTPYGGGMGMLMAAPPVVECFEAVRRITDIPAEKTKTVYLSPAGKLLTQKKALELATFDRLILLCGHYEGVDERAVRLLSAEEISVGDYVLTGGELPACILIDCVSRTLEGVLASKECHEIESIAWGMLEYPQYTRPESYRGLAVPEVLLSGDHKRIEQFRYLAALEKTKKQRPDLL